MTPLSTLWSWTWNAAAVAGFAWVGSHVLWFAADLVGRREQERCAEEFRKNHIALNERRGR